LSSLGQDSAEDAAEMSASLKPGDVLVLGTDGLFVNLWRHELCEVLKAGRLARTMQIADHLAEMAFRRSVDRKAHTPFSAAATEELNLAYSGGRKDDITVVVAKVAAARRNT
jgi:protein phosphatase PTC7